VIEPGSHLAAELVHSAPDVIVTFAVPATRAVQKLTRTIPIVAVALSDQTAGGLALVKSIARPEGNLTGFSAFLSVSLSGKWVQLLKAAVPQMSRRAAVSGRRGHDRFGSK
jgi:putative ABC transport system substrate-binding protein